MGYVPGPCRSKGKVVKVRRIDFVNKKPSLCPRRYHENHTYRLLELRQGSVWICMYYARMNHTVENERTGDILHFFHTWTRSKIPEGVGVSFPEGGGNFFKSEGGYPPQPKKNFACGTRSF